MQRHRCAGLKQAEIGRRSDALMPEACLEHGDAVLATDRLAHEVVDARLEALLVKRMSPPQALESAEVPI